MSLTSVTAHRRAYGQFFTPEPVVACCYQLCAERLPAMPQIVDPACGDGAFLRYAAAHAFSDRDRISGCDLELARPGGQVALVLPSGVLANQRLLTLRAGLLARHTLLAVIALPRETFRHTGTSADCSIVLLRNAPALPGHLVFFALPEQLEDLPGVATAYHSH